MRNSPKPVFITAAALALAAGAAGAASDYLLTIGDIKGGAIGASPIEVHSYSWGASNPTPVKEPRDASTGQASGKRVAPAAVNSSGQAAAAAAPQPGELRSLTLAMRESPTLASSPLVRACASGKHFGSVTLNGRGSTIVLKDVMVSSCAVEANQRKLELKGHVTLIK
jgi:hypothetical protein